MGNITKESEKQNSVCTSNNSVDVERKDTNKHETEKISDSTEPGGHSVTKMNGGGATIIKNIPCDGKDDKCVKKIEDTKNSSKQKNVDKGKIRIEDTYNDEKECIINEIGLIEDGDDINKFDEKNSTKKNNDDKEIDINLLDHKQHNINNEET